MRIGIVFLLVTCLVSACSKDEEVGFTSLLGSWTYTTPDEKIQVTFDIVGGTSNVLAFQNQVIVVDGQEGKAEIQSENITETTVGLIRINANDADLDLPYNIVFNNLTTNDEFTIINVESATYTWPWQTSNALSNIQIARKQ